MNIKIYKYAIVFTVLLMVTNASNGFSLDISKSEVNKNYQTKKNKNMKHELIVLPYAENALEPTIGAETIALHHGKHLQGYVNNLNNLIQGTVYENMSLEQIIIQSDGAIFNNAAQVMNHNFFFQTFSPDACTAPQGELAKAIDAKWGSYDEFKKAIEAASMSLFGSGWVWLVKDQSGELQIVNEPNAGNPITKAMTPLLCVDVWEHAYYLDYNNRRLDFAKSIWAIIDWKIVESRY